MSTTVEALQRKAAEIQKDEQKIRTIAAVANKIDEAKEYLQKVGFSSSGPEVTKLREVESLLYDWSQ